MKSNIYIPQSPDIKSVIQLIWQVDNLNPFKKEIIIPKGVIEIIFDLSECNTVDSMIGNKKYQLAKCFINGFNTHPVQLQLPKRHFFFGVQFHPVAIKHLFGIQACELSNLLIDVALLDKSVNSLWNQLAESETFNERVNVISGWARNKIMQPHPREVLLNSFLEKTSRHKISVKGLAEKVCYSPRQLSRKIYELTGMNAEQFLLYKKYLHSVNLIHHTNLALTEIAYDSDFADQSHFIKSFKSFAHITPGEYRQNKSNIPGHFFMNVR